MDFSEDQLLRIAKVITSEEIFQKVFDQNLKGEVTDGDVIRHVEYYEKNGKLYGYSGVQVATEYAKLYGKERFRSPSSGRWITKISPDILRTLSELDDSTKRKIPSPTRRRKRAVAPTRRSKKKADIDKWMDDKETFLDILIFLESYAIEQSQSSLKKEREKLKRKSSG